MRLLDFASVKLSVFLILGILLGYHFEWSITVSSIILGISLLILGISYLKQTRRGFPFFGFLTIISVAALGIFVTTLSEPKNWPTYYSEVGSTQPQTHRLKITEVLKPTPFSIRYYAKVREVDGAPVTGKLLLSQNMDSLNENMLHVDDEVLLFARPEPVAAPLNPHQFDYRDYLKKQRIYHQIKLQTDNYFKLKNSSSTIFGFSNNLRQAIISQLKKENFGKDELSIIQALLLGQRNDISEETYDNYKNAGAVHILAVSGLHIGILLLLMQFLFKPIERLPNGKKLKLVIIVLLLWCYALLAGLSPSIVRAVTMFSFLAYAMHLNRPVNMFNILALSLFFILVIEPLFLFQVGFQMSYAAVFAILWVYPKLQHFWTPKSLLVRKAWQLFSVGLAAQLGVLPISLFYFHQFPVLFFVSNLVIVPFLGIILGLGVLVIVLALLNSLPNFLVTFYDVLIAMMNRVIGWVAQQEAFIFQDISFDVIHLVLGYILIISLVLTLSKPTFKRIALLLIGIACFQSYSIFNQLRAKDKEQLIVAHQTRNTLLLYQNKGKLQVFGPQNGSTERLVKDYSIAEHIDTALYTELQNSYEIGEKRLFIIDSVIVHPPTNSVDYLVLTQSPKINLERLLDSTPPQLVLADGSNFKSYVSRWKKTCQNKKIPFHYTGEKGAYYFELNVD